MIRGIHHVAIHTPDLDRLRTFYERAFGFVPANEEFDAEDFPLAAEVMGVEGAAVRIQMLRTQNCYVELFEWRSPEGRPLQPLRPYDFGYTHFCVDVTDIDAEHRRLSELGMEFVQREVVRFGDLAALYGRDPDGNVIEIVEIPASEDLHLNTPTITSGLKDA